jgi:osmoprotectant transport system ATP-binding protein
LQDELLSIQQRVKKTILFVTHDVEEALRLADCIAIMRAGKVVQYDTPLNIVSSPADPFVASLVGSEDAVRLLGLLHVSVAMRPSPAGYNADGMYVEPTCTLRDALNLLLSSNAVTVRVVSPVDGLLGVVGLEDIRRVTRTMRGGALGTNDE